MSSSRLSIYSWSIWLKLAVGFLIALLAPVVIVYIALRPSLNEISLQNLRSFLSENGQLQRVRIEDALTEAHIVLETFLENEDYNRQITALLLRDTPLFAATGSLRVDPITAGTLFQTAIMNSPTSFFRGVRVLDRDGRLAAEATQGLPPTTVVGEDQSNSDIYQAVSTAALTGSTRVMTVNSQVGDGVIQIAKPIYWRDGNIIGYLIGVLNKQNVLYDNMTLNTPSFSAYSYLVSNNNIYVSPPQYRTQVDTAQNSTAVTRALTGQTGLDAYRIDQGIEAVGFYTPIEDAPLALIVEAPVAAAFGQAQTFLDTRLFVLAIGTLALIAVLVFFFNQLITPPLLRLRDAHRAILAGDFGLRLPDGDRVRQDEIGELTNSFLSMRQQVSNLVQDLEARIAARARDISATQEISRYAATQRDLQELLNRVVNLIIERFMTIYHAQIFLVDAENRYAVLRASTGEVGAQLLARGHRLAIGSVSVIGQVSEHGRNVHVRDTSVSPIHQRNEFLPNTRAELAIPLRVGDTIIGALDVQSRQSDAFNEDLIAVLQTMGDQIAVAIQNARLYQESIRRLEEIEQANRLATLRAWQEYMRDQRTRSLESTAGIPTTSDMDHLRRQAIQSGEIAVGKTTARQTVPVAVPIQLRGQILGAVEWELSQQDLDDNKLQLAQDLANRLAVSLDNARLFEESQRAVQREQLVNSIAAKLTAQSDIDQILQTAVREVGQALRAPQVSLRLYQPAESTSTNGTNGSSNGHHDEKTS